MLSRLLTRKEQFVLLAFAGAIAIGAVALYTHRQQAAADPEPPPAPVWSAAQQSPPRETAPSAQSPNPTPPESTAKLPEIKVSIVGAISKPGVYALTSDSRVQDLIEAAGGTPESADLRDINLAAKLFDGSTLSISWLPTLDAATKTYVYPPQYTGSAYNPPQYTISGWQPISASGAGSTVPTPSTAAAPGGHLNLNMATSEQLETLPGIGPKLAQEIVRYRSVTPFRQVEDLANVNGIGLKRLEQVRPYVTAP